MARAALPRSSRPDPTVYPVSDNMGESTLEIFVRLGLLPLVERYLAAQGVTAFVGASQFIYWVQYEPTSSVAPDLYVVPGLAPRTQFDSIKTWEDGRVPSFALEVVSKNKRKDYEQSPERYAALGVRELIIYDPKAARRRGGGVTWQVYRRVAKRGFVQVDVSQTDRVRSKVLGCFLREVRGPGEALALRLGVGPEGDELVPTEAEEERAEKEREQAARQKAEAAQREAEAEIARLRAMLGRGGR